MVQEVLVELKTFTKLLQLKLLFWSKKMNTGKLKNIKLKKQSGFTLIEIAVVLLILGLLTAGFMWTSSGKTDGARVSVHNAFVGDIISQIRKYGTSGSYGTTSYNQVLIDNEKIPNHWTVSGTTITHSLGGVFSVTGKSANFAMTTTGLSRSNCVDHVTSMAAGVDRVFVDSSTTPPANVTTGGSTGSITAIDANTLCASATNNSVHLVGR